MIAETCQKTSSPSTTLLRLKAKRIAAATISTETTRPTIM